MADVKSMLTKFEQADSMSAGRGNNPNVAVKPVFQRFQQAKENASTTTPSSSSSSSSAPNPIFKSGHPPAVKLAGLTGAMPALKPTTANSSSSNSADKGGRINVPKAFQNGKDPSVSNDSDNNNNSDQATNRTEPWTKPKSPPEKTSSVSEGKPPVMPKFPSMSISNNTLTNNSSKPQFPLSKSGDKNFEKSNSKPAILPPNNARSKSDSIRSNSSNSSSSSASSLSSSSNQTSSIVSTPKSPPSSSPTNTSGVFDFKSQLRKVNTSSSGPPGKRVLSGVSTDSSSSESHRSNTPVSATSSNASTTSSTNTDKSKTQSRVPPIPSTENVAMRSKLDQSTDDIVVRKSDGKRFRRLPPPSHKSSTTPMKPAVPTDIDLSSIRQQYVRLKQGSDDSQDTQPVPEVEEEDNLYWDGMSAQNEAPPRPPKKPSAADRASQRISLIPEMSPEEEEGVELPVYDDTPIEDDIYDDAMSERPKDLKPKTSTSSEPTETEQEKKKRLKEEATARKKEEKEKREKEKREREEEKKRKKKEEEEMRLRSKFNLTGKEKMVGEGVIKQDAKGGGLNLKVKKGQIVTIVRLDSNPPNKWLIKIDTQVGYVDSQNIEVDPNIIRQTMKSQSEEDIDQPTYDDVPEENGHPPIVPMLEDEEEEGEEIYEMCE